MNAMAVVSRLEGDRLGRLHEFGAETARLHRGFPGQIRAGDPLMEAEIVLDPRASARLTPGGLPLDQRCA
jgi:hypothetical protein